MSDPARILDEKPVLLALLEPECFRCQSEIVVYLAGTERPGFEDGQGSVVCIMDGSQGRKDVNYPSWTDRRPRREGVLSGVRAPDGS